MVQRSSVNGNLLEVIEGSDVSAAGSGGSGPQGPQGPTGPAGASAYDIWVAGGGVGTEADFLTALAGAPGADGKTAYQSWLDVGNTGTESDFANALIGPAGPAGAAGTNGVDGIDGTDGTNGAAGADGPSAYDVWIAAGNAGTVADFLTALTGPAGVKGDQGDPGATGPAGTPGADGTDGTNGAAGPSAYDAWTAAGNVGTPAQFLASLVGPAGGQGIQGPIGPTGNAGNDGADGSIGPTGSAGADGADGASAYEEWIAAGNVGNEAAFLADIVGAQGPQGIQGVIGPAGTAGTNGTDGTDGVDGAAGPAGPGLPVGGTVGQIPIKASGTDFDTNWGAIPAPVLDWVVPETPGALNDNATLVPGHLTIKDKSLMLAIRSSQVPNADDDKYFPIGERIRFTPITSNPFNGDHIIIHGGATFSTSLPSVIGVTYQMVVTFRYEFATFSLNRIAAINLQGSNITAGITIEGGTQVLLDADTPVTFVFDPDIHPTNWKILKASRPALYYSYTTGSTVNLDFTDKTVQLQITGDISPNIANGITGQTYVAIFRNLSFSTRNVTLPTTFDMGVVTNPIGVPSQSYLALLFVKRSASRYWLLAQSVDKP